jgi:hypothetical protein
VDSSNPSITFCSLIDLCQYVDSISHIKFIFPLDSQWPKSRGSPCKLEVTYTILSSYSAKMLATYFSENLCFCMVHSGEEGGPVPELSAHSRT